MIDLNALVAGSTSGSGAAVTAAMKVNTVTVNNKTVKYSVTDNGMLQLDALVGPKDRVMVNINVGNQTMAVQVQDSNDRIALANVNFDTASYALTPAAKAILDHVAKVVLQHGFTAVDLVGFTDSQGVASNYDNQTLSHNRAMQTRAYLKSLLGAHKVSITLDALAYAKPVAPNVTSTGRAANRRVEIDVH
jgi:outer membrane protein OmpA-like peptidoglycan-associated protein